jgi:diguanylate cyclase (GGDEF)-like protein/hemerythrin-like metal-binding protein/PAS domain S-box-containing protein
MRYFHWNKRFEIGIPILDQQHRTIVDLINNLATAILEGGELPDTQLLIHELMLYVSVHFRDEEQILATSPLTKEEKECHLLAHRGFVDKVQEIASRPDLSQATVAQQVLEFLTTWLVSHILGSDMKIAQAMMHKDGAPDNGSHLFGVSTVERLLLAALNDTERQFRLMSDHTPIIIWVSDGAGKRTFFNRAWYDFTGCITESIQTIRWEEYLHPEDKEDYLAQIGAVLTYPASMESEYRLRHHTGDYHWFLERILPRTDSDGVWLGLIASATDITAIKQAEDLVTQSNAVLEKEVARRTEQLEKLMLTDPLTGVGNRRFLTKGLNDEVLRTQRYHHPLSVAFIDIDHFKVINDKYGHATGDMVLACLARSLQSGLRDCDLLGRFGGEEFVLILPETGLDDALSIAERIRKRVAKLDLLPKGDVVTVSVGLAELLPDETAEELLARSDKSLYRAKEDGRNCCRMEI